MKTKSITGINFNFFLKHINKKDKMKNCYFTSKLNHLLLLGFIFSLLTITSCKKTDYSAKSMPESIGTYIYAYTSGVISRGSEVKIRFNAPVIAEDKIGSEVDKKVLNISPSVEGKASWEDDRTIVFTPDTYFNPAQQFRGRVYLNTLFENVPQEAQLFEFNFRTKEQYFSVEIDGVQPTSNEDLTSQEILGSVYLTDVEDLEQVKKLVVARQKGRSLKIDWAAGATPVEFKFTVNEVERNKGASAVDIKWNGKHIGVSEKGNKEIEVPALGNFKVVNAKVEKKGDQHIVVSFSDPLQSTQNLQGLFQISGYNGKLRYSIDGNQVKVYPSKKMSGTKTLTVSEGVANAIGANMKDPSIWTFEFEDVLPAVKLVGKGVIMPESKGLIFPFEAVNLNAVEVEIFQIFENNLLQFLQTNNMDGDYQLSRVGRIIHREKVSLGALNPNADKSKMSRYAIDLKNLIQNEPGAIYQVRIGFLPSYSDYFCSNNKNKDELTLVDDNVNDNGDIQSIMDSYYGVRGYYSGYNWSDRNNPCKGAYYNSDRFIKRNVFASNLGMVAKRGKDGSLFVAVSDLRTTDPISGAVVKTFDYQQQLISQTSTDGDGVAFIENKREPYFLVVENGIEKGYMKIKDGHSLSLSRFDISGAVTQKGLKGYVYGERGVWRPGDTLHLNFILEDKENKLPSKHPVTMEIYDPRGQLQKKMVQTENVSGIYSFTTHTASDDPTGSWRAQVKVGGATFTKYLKIETVKPNRLKVNVDFGKEELAFDDLKPEASIQANWLHGAPAKNLKCKVEMQYRQQNTTFKKYKDYEFDDPARAFSSEPVVVFNQNLNSEGKATMAIELNAKGTAPGKLKAGVKTRVFEKSGDFSSDNFSISYSPYESYAGVSIAKNKYGEKRLDVGKKNKIDVVAVSEKGEPLKNRKLNVGLYRVNWSWWWDSDNDNFTSYNTSNHYGSIDKAEVTTNSKGDGKAEFKIERWGRYLVRVCDEESGHCTGDIFYAGYPWNDDESGANKAASMLVFTSDKQEYNVGDVMELNIPASEISKGLLTIENGTKVLESRWFSLKKGENKIKVQTSSKWAPNVYAHVTLTQPHAQTKNDLPIRMYGVIPIKVKDPKTELKPEIKIADKIRPEENFTVEVKEANGKPMAYTIAVVDEGLLDLTRFATPDPWNTFYAREALGVKTWDMYDYVLGAYGGDLERILSVGGGLDSKKKKSADQAQRFKPVVMHLGPFYLKAGRKEKHTLTMPNYIGSVRTMVVAANNGAYGNAEVTTPVKKPLMVLATLPRVLGPNEELKLPVNVFAMEKSIKNVSVTLETSDLIEIVGSKTKNISFSKPGDDLVNFDIKVKEGVGVAKVKVIAKSGAETATQEIEIQIRNPNPLVTDVHKSILEAGETWEYEYDPIGMQGTNGSILEVSNIPPINLGERLNYLIRYPHGCIEQTTSSGFPQLYVDKLLELNEDQKSKVPENVQATIDRLKKFQVSSGGFSYWPGGSEASEWGSNYGGHFMLEAKKLGYTVPSNMLDKWVRYQQRIAKNWTYKDKGFSDHGYYNNNDLMQAYRLYTLALVGKPDKGSMNRMRNIEKLSGQAKWRLAGAYALAGNRDVANKIIEGLNTQVEDYAELSYTYGSGLRDQAMILESLVAMGRNKDAAELIKDISEKISQQRWFSTQTVAYSLLSIGKFVGDSKVDDKFTFSYTIDGNTLNAGSSTPLFNADLPAEGKSKKLKVKNTSKGILYARLIVTGVPLQGDSTSASNKLKIAIEYQDADGKKLNPTQIQQGTDFFAVVSVTNPSESGRRYDEMALTQIFPSGWEITNARMDAVGTSKGMKAEYQDYRDDRVYTYFDIRAGKTHKYVIPLNAAYQGKYYLPSVSCEAMYDNTISARQPGGWVYVVTPKEI